ncbi:MAG: hypothetical protein AB1299_02765 [Thermoproteota archaeon]|nr:hypothetical protein [Candidatus Nitrosotenuis sp.]
MSLCSLSKSCFFVSAVRTATFAQVPSLILLKGVKSITFWHDENNIAMSGLNCQYNSSASLPLIAADLTSVSLNLKNAEDVYDVFVIINNNN